MKHLGLVLLLGTLFIAPPAFAEDTNPLKFNKGDKLEMTLSRHVGDRVELMLRSGESLSGTVKEVGTAVIHLSQLTGKEFFDALVAVDDVSAVVIRVKTN